MKSNRTLTIMQWFFGIYFIAVGVMHFIVPDGLPSMMSWMYDLDPTLHRISGTAEILGGLGLILPGLTGIRTELTWLAAAGLALVMLGASVWHIPRAEYVSVVQNVFFAGIFIWLANARRNNPIPSR